MKAKHRRRNNDAGLSLGSKIAIAGVVGLAAGGTIAWWIGGSEAANKAIDEIDLRLPQPSMKMVLPESLEEFQTIDEVICEAGAPLIDDAPPGTTVAEVIEKIRDHVLREFYPDFPWPPISGDNPTVGQLFTEIGVLVRRAVVTGNVCPPEGA